MVLLRIGAIGPRARIAPHGFRRAICTGRSENPRRALAAFAAGQLSQGVRYYVLVSLPAGNTDTDSGSGRPNSGGGGTNNDGGVDGLPGDVRRTP